MNNSNARFKKSMAAIHIAVWLVIVLAPLTFFERGDRFSLHQLVPILSSPISLMIVFYTTYLWLTPHFFLNDRKREFYLYTFLLVVGMGVLLHLWLTFSHMFLFDAPEAPQPPRHNYWLDTVFATRNIFNMAIAAVIATMSVLSIRLSASETARREAEMARADAELKNLRNQVNPHFLLNTLNNIYALTAFNTAKAQEAILELSAMLRHILYDNQQDYVNLADEVRFIQSYIRLMQMRISPSAHVDVSVSIPEPCGIRVAPLIFISLIENAFKHGIGTSGASFISISITADSEKIECDIQNSNHPKQQSDRSGHGIGLEHVTKRLELSYKGYYTWEKGLKDNNTTYYSKITIYDTKLCDN